MNFLRGSVDRAIVMTQYDLRGFGHPLGFRIKKPSAKSLCALSGNLMSFCCVSAEKGKQIEGAVGSFDSTYEQYLLQCEQLVIFCDESEKEAIQLIIKGIVKMHKRIRKLTLSGKMQKSAYLVPLVKSNRFGKVVLALAEAFEVKIVTKRGWVVSV